MKNSWSPLELVSSERKFFDYSKRYKNLHITLTHSSDELSGYAYRVNFPLWVEQQSAAPSSWCSLRAKCRNPVIADKTCCRLRWGPRSGTASSLGGPPGCLSYLLETRELIIELLETWLFEKSLFEFKFLEITFSKTRVFACLQVCIKSLQITVTSGHASTRPRPRPRVNTLTNSNKWRFFFCLLAANDLAFHTRSFNKSVQSMRTKFMFATWTHWTHWANFCHSFHAFPTHKSFRHLHFVSLN